MEYAYIDSLIIDLIKKGDEYLNREYGIYHTGTGFYIEQTNKKNLNNQVLTYKKINNIEYQINAKDLNILQKAKKILENI